MTFEQVYILNTCITKERVGLLVSMLPERNERYPWNDTGDGNLFADWRQDVARYVPERQLRRGGFLCGRDFRRG